MFPLQTDNILRASFKRRVLTERCGILNWNSTRSLHLALVHPHNGRVFMACSCPQRLSAEAVRRGIRRGIHKGSRALDYSRVSSIHLRCGIFAGHNFGFIFTLAGPGWSSNSSELFRFLFLPSALESDSESLLNCFGLPILLDSLEFLVRIPSL